MAKWKEERAPCTIEPSTIHGEDYVYLLWHQVRSLLHLKVLRIAGTVVSVVGPIHLLVSNAQLPGDAHEAGAMKTACGFIMICWNFPTKE